MLFLQCLTLQLMAWGTSWKNTKMKDSMDHLAWTIGPYDLYSSLSTSKKKAVPMSLFLSDFSETISDERISRTKSVVWSSASVHVFGLHVYPTFLHAITLDDMIISIAQKGIGRSDKKKGGVTNTSTFFF